MNNKIKRLVLSSSFLTNTLQFFYKKKIRRKFSVRCGKGSFIGFSTVFEGNNFVGRKSSITGSMIGFASYLAAGTHISNTKIGRFCSIGPNVNCVFGKHPANTFVSTHPTFFSPNKRVGFSFTETELFQEFSDPKDADKKYSIIVENDVWIGANVSLMDGVTIGNGAIVAANSLVNKDVPPYTIVGGVPAKPIKKRFTEHQIEFLLDLKWWDKPREWIADHAKLFIDIDDFHKKFENA